MKVDGLGVGQVVLLWAGKTTFAGLECEKGLQAPSLLQRDGGLLENTARLDKPNMVDLKISLILILLSDLLTVQGEGSNRTQTLTRQP